MLIEIEAYSNADGQTEMYIDCYSYEVKEFESVYKVLRSADVKYSEVRIRADKENRIGLRYSIIGRNIQKLENYLKIKFFSNEETNGDGEPYKCERISLTNETGCKTIFANDRDSASVICAIVAKKQRWFGGLAQRGQCRR